jgi:hypothetical protein
LGVILGLSQFKNQFKKNHALAQSLLSRVFSWDVVDVGFPTCCHLSLNMLGRQQLLICLERTALLYLRYRVKSSVTVLDFGYPL